MTPNPEHTRLIILAYKAGRHAYEANVPSIQRTYVDDDAQFAYDLGYRDSHRAFMNQQTNPKEI